MVQHKLTQCRHKDTEPRKFREIAEEISSMMLYEATSNLELNEIMVDAPLTSARGRRRSSFRDGIGKFSAEWFL